MVPLLALETALLQAQLALALQALPSRRAVQGLVLRFVHFGFEVRLEPEFLALHNLRARAAVPLPPTRFSLEKEPAELKKIPI
jgi:hypothetical protein